MTRQWRTMRVPLVSLVVSLTLAVTACSAPPETQVSLVAEPVATVPAAQVTACGPVREPPTPLPWLPAAPTSRPSQTVLLDALPVLSSMSSADRVVVQRSWNGRAPLAPRSATYTLARTRDNFVGEALFRVTIHQRAVDETREQRLPLTVPALVMGSVVRDLTRVTVSPGPYSPRVEWTDDYPDDLVQVTAGGRQVRFFSQSQGNDRTPWGIESGGQVLVSESADIARTLRRLDTCIQSDRYDAFISAADADYRFGPRAAPFANP